MTDALKVINFEGSLGIQESHSFYDRIMQSLGSGTNVILDLSQVASLDLSCAQIIIAAKKSARKKHLNLQLAHKVSSEVMFSLYTCGFIKYPSLSGKELNKALDEAAEGAR